MRILATPAVGPAQDRPISDTPSTHSREAADGVDDAELVALLTTVYQGHAVILFAGTRQPVKVVMTRMDGVNIYLGVGLVLVLAALVGGQVEALGIKIPALQGRMLRLVLACLGVTSMVAGYVAPLPGTAATERKDRQQDYKRQVLAACDAITATRSLGDNALRFDEDGKMLRDSAVAILQRQATQNQATLDELWSQEVPEGLENPQADARELGEAVLVFQHGLVPALQSMPPAFSQEQLDGVISDVSAESDGERTYARFRSAMSRLAGETCKLPA